MRSGFAGREEAIEKKFQHDSELAFKIRARRNRLFGFWAGEQLGLEGAELESYATRIVIFAVQSPDDNSLIQIIHNAFMQNNVEYSEHQIQKQLNYCQMDAKKEFSTNIAI